MSARGPESIWSYPSPPSVSPVSERIRVIHGGATIADSTRCLRVCEVGHGPTYYVPPADVEMRLLRPAAAEPGCAFKGRAQSYDVVAGDAVALDAAWSYLEPLPGWEIVAGHVAFYPDLVDRCLLDDEPAGGDVHGGWITSHVEGPFRLRRS